MAAIRALLNPTASTSAPSTTPTPTTSTSTRTHDPYDRAEAIALATARSMTPTPLHALPTTINTTATRAATTTAGGGGKRLLESPITSTADIHYRRFVSPSPTPTGTPANSRANSPAVSESVGLGCGMNMDVGVGVESPRKRPKIIKDAPVFTRGATRGEVRYPPFVYLAATSQSKPDNDSHTHSNSNSANDSTNDDNDDYDNVDGSNGTGGERERETNSMALHKTNNLNLQTYHDQFKLYPRQEDVAEYPRFIPYNSERRVFADATGRDFFEVFQYEFKPPGREEDKTYTMLWDYNVGLVRTTPLFKCCGYGKTTPAKMLNRNVGLREICHSITGGALVAQGYWMPYEAAKAVAATFCWSIRYALTPVFGIDFIDMCIPPDSDKFGVMMIDSKITRLCTEQAREYKRMELEHPHPRPTISVMGSPRTPTSPMYQQNLAAAPKFKAINVNDEASSSGYSTEESDGDGYVMSPTGAIFKQVGWKRDRDVPRSTPRLRLSTTPSPKSTIPKLKFRRQREDDEEYQVRITGASKKSSPAASVRERREDLRLMGLEMRNGRIYDVGDEDEMDIDAVGLGVQGMQSLRYHGGEERPATEGKGHGFGEKEAAKALMSLWGVRKVPERRASA